MKQLLLILVISMLPVTPVVAQAEIPDDLHGTLIVLNKSGHDASFIDLASGEVVATLPTGRGPHELVVTDDGKWAIGTDYSRGNSLTVFDVENLLVARTIDLSEYPRPHGILFLPGQQEVIISSEASRTVVIVNFHTGEIIEAIDTNQNGSHMVAVSEDGSVAYTSNGGSSSVSVIDVSNSQFERTISVPNRPEAITTNKSGSEIWVGSNDEEVVTVISSNDDEIIAQWEGFEWPYRILLTDDERYAIMPDLSNNDLRFFDARRKVELGSIDLSDTRPQGVVLYPDDRTLFLSLAGQDRILVIDVETRVILGEYAAGSSPDGIGYSSLELRRSTLFSRD